MHDEIESNSISGSRRVKSICPMIKSNLNTSRGCTTEGGWGRRGLSEKAALWKKMTNIPFSNLIEVTGY